MSRWIRHAAPLPAASGGVVRYKTSVIVLIDHKPGMLALTLQAFGVRGVNLMALQSRPERSAPWTYRFYVDVDGSKIRFHFRGKSGMTFRTKPPAVIRSRLGPGSLDLVADGPHALIGGTTGSGKSELLRSIVAAIAFDQPPDKVNLFLIDYKGGTAFEELVPLPHVVGCVTDLDRHLSIDRLDHAERGAVARQRSDLDPCEAGVRSFERAEPRNIRSSVVTTAMPTLPRMKYFHAASSASCVR